MAAFWLFAYVAGKDQVFMCSSNSPPSLTSPFFYRQRIVAIPACNEEQHIVPCLRALAAQKDVRPHKVVVWINNTRDDTYQRALAEKNRLPFDLEIVNVTYDSAMAHAGRARHDAMACAARNAQDDALLFTTDADGEVAPDWMEKNLEAFARFNVAAVFGRALLLPGEALKIPAHLHFDDDQEQEYGALLEQIAARIDPDPHDPWPRHAEHSGASIAVIRKAWETVGGIPLIPTGEDRRFYEALRRGGFPVRHAPDVKVYVSARVIGRAHGGMAETIARRIVRQDDYIDDALEMVSARMLRIRKEKARRFLGDALAPSTPLPKPRLIRRAELAQHQRRARRVLGFLNRRIVPVRATIPCDAAGRSDTTPSVPHDLETTGSSDTLR